MEKKKIDKNQNPSVLRTSPLDKGDAYELSYQTKTLITVFLLVMVYPVGLILMFVWMRWSKWVNFLIALPAILTVIIPIFILLAVGTTVMRDGRERRGMINNQCPMIEKGVENQLSPTVIQIVPLNR